MNESEAFPWSVLGLNPTSATERDVKKAYAILVKQNRPDRDSEAFQRIHGAYESALAQLQQAQREIGMAPPTVDAPDHPSAGWVQGVSSSSVLPGEWQVAESDMRQALSQGDSARLKEGLAKMREMANANPALVPAWEQSLLQTFEKDFAQLAQTIRGDDVQLMIRERCEHLPEALLGFWHATGSRLPMEALADFLIGQKPPLDYHATVLLQARLSLYLAFANLSKAEQLTNAVFPLMPPQMRDWILPRLENRLALAKIFRTLPAESRRYWEQNLCPNEDETIVWNEPELRTQFRELTMRCPADWPGYQILSEVMPKPLFNRMTMQFRPQQPKVQATALTKEPTFPKFFIHALIILALLAFRNIHSCSDSTERYRSDRNRNLNNSRPMSQREIQEMLDKLKARKFNEDLLKFSPREK